MHIIFSLSARMTICKIEKARFKLKKLTVFIVLLECLVLVILLITSSRTSHRTLNLARTAKYYRNKLSRCPAEKKETILNASLPVSMYDNVQVKDELFSKCFTINKTRSGLYRLMEDRNFVGVICNKTKKRFFERDKRPIYTALASYPGSGNTWVRHLLEELTGVHTGGVYMDRGLREVFMAERFTERVIAIKTHEPVNKLTKLKFDRVILLIRDPFDALLSEYNLGVTMSHTNIPSKEKFNNESFYIHLTTKIKYWKSFYLDWLKYFDGQIFVLFYNNLRTDLLNSLTKMAAFFGTDVTLRQLWCIQNNKDGSFWRKKKPDWMDRSKLLDKGLDKNLSTVKAVVYDEIKKRRFDLKNFTTN